jgi:hypothetical protein
VGYGPAVKDVRCIGRTAEDCLAPDNLSKAGWSRGCVSAGDSIGRTIWIADAHRDDGKRFVVRANEKLTAFIELESVICTCDEICLDKRAKTFPDSTPLNGSESGGGLFPR